MNQPHRSPFWKTKSLAEMTPAEWEALCDGCGRCCLGKLENKQTGKVYFTNVACYLLDLDRCRCKAYEQRTHLVPDCVVLIPANLKRIRWLPQTCAYRLLAEGKGLAWWHPLVSGEMNTVHTAGISIRGKAISEENVHPDHWEDYVVEWS